VVTFEGKELIFHLSFDIFHPPFVDSCSCSFVVVRVISWIVLHFSAKQSDPRNHTNGHEIKTCEWPMKNRKWKMI